MRVRAAHSYRAFTLIEVIVGVLVTAIIASLAGTSLARLSRMRTGVEFRRTAMTYADTAADRIAADAMCLTRDHDLRFCRIVVRDGEDGARERDDLLLLTRSLEPVRPGEPESAEHEVQYRIEDMDGQPALRRRVDHALDRAYDGGGIVRSLAPGAQSLDIQAYDGSEWRESWDSDYDGLPHALRVILTVRVGNTVITARRVIAIDRTPIPVDPVAESTTAQGGGA